MGAGGGLGAEGSVQFGFVCVRVCVCVCDFCDFGFITGCGVLLQAEVRSLPVTLHLQKVHAELLQDTAKGGFHPNPKPPADGSLASPSQKQIPAPLTPS